MVSHQPKCDLGEVTSMNPSIYEVNVSYRVTLVQKKKNPSGLQSVEFQRHELD